jgi:thiol-disulfide isomerase/thioredoxin
MRRWIVGVFALFLFTNFAAADPNADAVRLDLVTYKQLGNEIRNLHGKVVLVDFWADYCKPCKQKFPHVMALHRKYANQGFTVVSVSVDDVTDADTRERVKDYLLQQKATCRNLLLAEKPEVWVPKLKMDSIPAMILFDRDGRMINRWDGNDISLQSIEKRITELLATSAKP